MERITASATEILDARPEDVYATIADYKNGHPRILPKGKMYDLKVEKGGYGAGTVHRFKARSLGVEKAFYQIVEEPEPGRVILEKDIDPGQDFVTTFTVDPMEGGQKSRVEISTTMTLSPGFTGWVERFVITKLNPNTYREELKLLESVARERGALQKRKPLT